MKNRGTKRLKNIDIRYYYRLIKSFELSLLKIVFIFSKNPVILPNLGSNNYIHLKKLIKT